MIHKRLVSAIVLVLLLVLLPAGSAIGQGEGPGVSAVLGTGFTYQGELADGGGRPVSDGCDFRFSLWDAAGGGTQVGSASTVSAVRCRRRSLYRARERGGRVWSQRLCRAGALAAGCGALPGRERELPPLSPRQELTAAPYALYAARAPWSGLGGVPAGFADGADDNTTYSAGAGLTLSGTQFRVNLAGSGSSTAVARADHHHLGQTWTGSNNPLQSKARSAHRPTTRHWC